MFTPKRLHRVQLYPVAQLPLYLKDFIPQPPKQHSRPSLRAANPLVAVRSGIGSLLTEFCSSSSIHGVNYIGSRQRSHWERFWWIVMLVLSMYGCGILIQNIYYKWQSNPVILTFDEQPTPVWQIPFPAVTICPEGKFRPECLNFTNTYEKIFGNEMKDEPLEEEEIQVMLSVLQVCDRMYSTDPYQTILKKYRLQQDIVHQLKRISPGATQKLFVQCRISMYPCIDLFKETLTDEGICYTFNLVPENEMFRKENMHNLYDYLESPFPESNWTMDGGYKPNTDLWTYPSRVFGAGFEAGLYLQVTIPTSYEENHCREAQGFKVMLHSPAEYPMMSKKFIRLTYDNEVTMAIRPDITTTSDVLRKYPSSKRQCFFSHERPLKFFAIYNQANCELECLTNFTRKLCGCVRFSMPRSSDTRLCESSELECAIDAERNIQIQVASEGIQMASTTDERCHCLPACNSVEYDAELTQTKYNFLKSFSLRYKSQVPDHIIDKYTNNKFAKLAIYFKHAQYMAQKRSELFGWTDFIANCGGVLGLCMGVSLLSFAELLYYCLIRPLMLVRSFRRGQQKGVVSVQPSSP